MLDIYLDTETTGTDVYNSEIIEAYFEVYDNGEKIDHYYLRSSVLKWSNEAQEIHGISEKQAMSYDNKSQAYFKLLRWLPSNFKFITYANKNYFGETINFDVAILMNELDLQGYSSFYFNANYKPGKHISVHDLAKKLKNRIGIVGNLSQENVYKHLFGGEYNAHNAVDDVQALVKIHKKLLELDHDDQSILTLS